MKIQQPVQALGRALRALTSIQNPEGGTALGA